MGAGTSRINVQAMRASYRRLDSAEGSMDASFVNIQLDVLEPLGKGHFGTVHRATLQLENQETLTVALKKTVFNPNLKDREVAMLRSMRHVNVIRLFYFYWTKGERRRDPTELNMVLEFMPNTMHHHLQQAQYNNVPITLIETKVWCFQLLRAVQYMHGEQVCHRDLKPHNLLLRRETGLLKVGDFGSAKVLDPNNNVPYIVSRWYRAPELILQNRRYTNKIDVWSCGCIVGELLRNRVLFPAERDGPHMLMIMRALGTPDLQQIEDMHPREPFHPPRMITHRPWSEVLPSFVPASGSELVTDLLQWSPNDRLTAADATAHKFFDEVRNNQHLRLPNGNLLDRSIFDDVP